VAGLKSESPAGFVGIRSKVRYFADPEFQGLFDRPDASALSPARPVPVAAE